MRFASRAAVAAVVVFAPLMNAGAQTAGRTLAIDFRMTNSVQGTPDTGVIVGHAIGTADKMRLDLTMKGASAKVTPISDSTVSMIVTDSGKTITYLDVKKSQFLRVRPAEMVAQAQQMGGMKMDFSVWVFVGLLLVVVVTWVVIYNAPALLGAAVWAFGRIRALAPVLKTSVAQSLRNRFRTGTTIALFTLVVFVLVTGVSTSNAFIAAAKLQIQVAHVEAGLR